MATLTDLAEGDAVELVDVAAGTVWFVKPVNPYRVQLGIIRPDGREWAGDLDPTGIAVEMVDGRFVIEHLDYEDTCPHCGEDLDDFTGTCPTCELTRDAYGLTLKQARQVGAAVRRGMAEDEAVHLIFVGRLTR